MKFATLLAAATALWTGLATSPSARADVSFVSGPIDALIPDDTDTGLAHTVAVPASISFSSVRITLDLEVPAGGDAWFGDLFAYVQHDSGMAVLLNRPGRTDTATSGYDDGKNVSVSFADDAANGDIHSYRVKLFGSETTPLTDPLTGVWLPDGRTVDPSAVLGTDPRGANLGVFGGLGSGGDWTLFVSDHSSGGQYRLKSWGVDFQGSSSPIPEPGNAASMVGLGLLAVAIGRRAGRGNREKGG